MSTSISKRKRVKEDRVAEDKLDPLSSIDPQEAKEYFRHNETVLFRGDTLNEKLFGGEFIDLIVTSPPYNVDIQYNSHKDDLTYEGYLEFSKAWIANCFKWSKPQARFCLNIPLDKNKGGQKSVGADLTIMAQQIGWKYHTTIVWNEGNISRRTAWGSWLSASAPFVIAPVELIVVLYKEGWKKTGGTKKSEHHSKRIYGLDKWPVDFQRRKQKEDRSSGTVSEGATLPLYKTFFVSARRCV